MLTFSKALVFDTETTGIPDFHAAADAPHQPRVVEFGGILIDTDFNELRAVDMLVRPNGWEIPAEATTVNGITQAMLEEGGSPIEAILDEYDAMIAECDLVVCFSKNFDLKMMRGEIRRSDPNRPDHYGTRMECDVIWECRTRCKGRLPQGSKSVSLELAHEILLNDTFVNPHRAMSDARATARLFRHLLPLGGLKAKVSESKRETVAA